MLVLMQLGMYQKCLTKSNLETTIYFKFNFQRNETCYLVTFLLSF